MNTFPKKRFFVPCALLLSACGIGPNWSIEWTVGTWTEGEYAAGTTEDEVDDCGIVALLNDLESPLQYELGPESETDTGYSVVVSSSDELTDENIAIGTENLWDVCSQPNDWNGPRFRCDFAFLELHKAQWEAQFQAQFCPDASVLSFRYNHAKGLLVNANEIFVEHRLEVICNSGWPSESSCNSTFVSRLRPSSGN